MPINIKNEIDKIEKELEEFKDKLNDDIINSFRDRLDNILNNFINNIK